MFLSDEAVHAWNVRLHLISVDRQLANLYFEFYWLCPLSISSLQYNLDYTLVIESCYFLFFRFIGRLWHYSYCMQIMFLHNSVCHRRCIQTIILYTNHGNSYFVQFHSSSHLNQSTHVIHLHFINLFSHISFNALHTVLWLNSSSSFNTSLSIPSLQNWDNVLATRTHKIHTFIHIF